MNVRPVQARPGSTGVIPSLSVTDSLGNLMQDDSNQDTITSSTDLHILLR